MSVNTDLYDHLKDVDEVVGWQVDDAEYHGVPAKKVIVTLRGGRYVEGVFTTEEKAGFGGVTFSQRKQVAALMKSKVESVLAGTAE